MEKVNQIEYYMFCTPIIDKGQQEEEDHFNVSQYVFILQGKWLL